MKKRTFILFSIIVTVVLIGCVTLFLSVTKELKEQTKIQDLRVLSESELMNTQVESILENGFQLYRLHCMECHGIQGKGSRHDIPDLGQSINTFNYFYNSIRLGRTKRGMPAWGNKLKESDIIAIAAYLYFLQGDQKKLN